MLNLTSEQQELCAAIAEFGKTLNDGMVDRDLNMVFSRDLWKRCGEFGIQGLPIPAEYGGSNRDLPTTLLAIMALGKACRDNGLVFGMNAQMWSVQLPLLNFGTPEQKRKYLPPLCAGDMIAAHAVSEPEHGSDIMSLEARAVRDGDFYVLNGVKTYITNAPPSDMVVFFATLNPALKAAGVTAFIIDRGTPGLEISQPFPKMGLRTVQMGSITCRDCRIPVSQRLGGEGSGFHVFNSAMGWERTCIFGAHLGAMEYQLEETIAFAKGRKQFGERLSRHAPIADKIVNMKVAIEAGKLLLYHAASVKQAGGDPTMAAAIAKLFVSEAHVKQALEAIQIHGAYGVLTDNQVERELRDAVPGTLYSGTSEMQRKIIASLLKL